MSHIQLDNECISIGSRSNDMIYRWCSCVHLAACHRSSLRPWWPRPPHSDAGKGGFKMPSNLRLQMWRGLSISLSSLCDLFQSPYHGTFNSGRSRWMKARWERQLGVETRPRRCPKRSCLSCTVAVNFLQIAITVRIVLFRHRYWSHEAKFKL